jgi:hypothetical protein
MFALSARFSFQFALSAMGGSKIQYGAAIEARNRWISVYLRQINASNRGKELLQVTFFIIHHDIALARPGSAFPFRF